MKWLTLFPLLFLSGCGTAGSGIRWYAPATWFSGKPATDADKAERKESEAKQAALKLAQKATHETQIALAAAPVSRPVDVATSSSTIAASLLDQIAGPLTTSELNSIRSTIAGLLSENAEVRAQAERAQARNSETVAEISTRLAKAHAASEVADRNLKLAFERENQLANDLRAQRALIWIVSGVAVLGFAGWIYVRYFLGGIPNAVGSALAALEKSHPDMVGTPDTPGPLRVALNQGMNRSEQTAIRNGYIKAR